MADPFGDLSGIRSAEESKQNTVNELSTLDEPVSETIKRDLMRIYSKLKIVINPWQLGGGPDNIEEKRREVRNWDLWGPFIFCLFLSV